MCTVEEKERWIIKGSKVSFDVLPWKMQITCSCNEIFIHYFCSGKFWVSNSQCMYKIIEDWNVLGLEVTAKLASLTPNEVAKMGFTRGSLMRALVGSPPSRNAARGPKPIPGERPWNGDPKWPPEAFMGTLLQVKSNTTSAQKLCSLNVHSGHNFPTMCDGIFINCTIGFF